MALVWQKYLTLTKLQPLVVRLTFPKKLSQTYLSPVIPVQCPVVTKLYGVLLPKIFALMHLLSQLTPSPCPLVLVSSLLMTLSPCPVELLPSPLATLMACRLAQYLSDDPDLQEVISRSLDSSTSESDLKMTLERIMEQISSRVNDDSTVRFNIVR